MQIHTNNHWRQFLYRYEVPDKVLESDFDWLNEDEVDYFIKYKNCYYHLSEFMQIENHYDSEFSSWHGYNGDSYFSGTVIRISDCGDSYQIGWYCS